MRHFPIFMLLHGRRALVMGEGETAERKAEALRRAGAEIVQAATFSPALLDGCAIAVGASADEAAMRALYEAAMAAGIPVNVVDRPEMCSFITPAIVDRDPILIAISSAGTAPVLARMLRSRIETLIAPTFGRLALIADEFKSVFRSKWPDMTARRRVLEALLSGPAAEAVFDGREDDARTLFQSALGDAPSGGGQVFLVGAGSGIPDLQTLRMQRLVGEADVVVHDRTVPLAVLDMARRDAGRMEASGENATDLLIGLARGGRKVVRLALGDGSDFSKSGGEAEMLAAAGVAVQIVPGLSR